MYSGPFSCLMKLGGKWAELVQKFVPQSRVGIFRNERTRSTPLDPKLIFWCISYHWVHSGLFGCVTKLSGKRAELVQKFVPRSRGGIFHNQRTRSTPLDPQNNSLGSNGLDRVHFWCVSYYLGAFGTVWLPHETRRNSVQNGPN